MSDSPDGGAVSDPAMRQLLEWRRNPTALATLRLCSDLEARPSIDLVAIVAKVVAREHWDSVDVVRALGRLQIRAGLHSQGRRTMLRAAKLEALGKPPPVVVVVERRRAPEDAVTDEHQPPQLLLDLLRGLDDDDAIESVARRVGSKPPPRTRSSTQRIAALGGLSRSLDRLPVEIDVAPRPHHGVSSSPPPPPPAAT